MPVQSELQAQIGRRCSIGDGGDRRRHRRSAVADAVAEQHRAVEILALRTDRDVERAVRAAARHADFGEGGLLGHPEVGAAAIDRRHRRIVGDADAARGLVVLVHRPVGGVGHVVGRRVDRSARGRDLRVVGESTAIAPSAPDWARRSHRSLFAVEAPAARLAMVQLTVLPVTVADWPKPVGLVSSAGSASSTVTLLSVAVEVLVTVSVTVVCRSPVALWKSR